MPFPTTGAHTLHSAQRHVVALVSTLAVVLCLLGFAGAPPAAAAPPSPTGLTASGSGIPSLTWNRLPGAVRYHVQGAENASFTSPVFDLETINTTYVPTRVLTPGTLYWRVRAIDADGLWGPFGSASWSVSGAPAPANLTVSAGQSTSPPAKPPVITWSPVTSATSYDLELDPEGDGVGGVLVGGIRGTTYVWPEPQGVEDYHVRVRANFENGLQTAWSAYRRYVVDSLPPVTSASCPAGLVCAPDPATGARSAVNVQDVVLDWDPVPGAKAYEIRVATDSSWNNVVDSAEVSTTRYSPTTTYNNNTYFWQVRAINAAGQAMGWPNTTSSFQRSWPQAPSLVYPPTSLVGDDFYFQWTPVKHATRYQLDVSPNSSFTPGTFATCTTASTTYTPGYEVDDPCMVPQGSARSWRVRAIDGPKGVQGIYSSVRTTTYSSGEVQRTAPAAGATVAVPTLRWQPHQDANQYDVRVYASNGQERAGVTTYALSWTPSELLDPADGPFTWTVSALDADGKRSPVSDRTFSLSAPPAGGPGAPDPLAGAAEPTGARFPQLRWQPVAGAAYYRLQVSATPGFWLDPSETEVLRRAIRYPTVTDETGYFLQPGTYRWRAIAYDDNNVSIATGAAAEFTITEPDAVGGRRLGIDGMSVTDGQACATALTPGDPASICSGVPTTPVLDWSPVAGAGGYIVYVAEDADLTNLVLAERTTNSRWVPTSPLPDNESGQAYYWFVRPCVAVNPEVNCGPDPQSLTDAATNAFRKQSPAVSLTTPAAGASFADEVTFGWEDYLTTNQGLDYAGSARPSHQEASQYRIQVRRDGQVEMDRIVDQTTYTHDSTFAEGDLEWRVAATDASDQVLTWSPWRAARKSTPATNLDPGTAAPHERASVDPAAFPAFGSHQPAGLTQLAWTAHDFDSSWTIEVYRNDDVTGSHANRVFTGTSQQAAFVAEDALPASSEPYRWRVRRTDSSGHDGAWSDYGRFYVDAASPVLTSPSDGLGVEPDGVVLRWTPQTGASRYRVEVTDANGAVVTSETTSASAWAPPSELSSGSYRWRVTSFDLGDSAIGSTQRGFVVDAGLHATAAPQVFAPGGTGVGATLTSAAPSWSRSGVVDSYAWLRDGEEVGATGATYTLSEQDYGRTISLRVTGRRAGYASGTTVSNSVVATTGSAIYATSAPTVTGTPRAGESLGVQSGGWSMAGVELRFQWLRSGVAIPGQTGDSYEVLASDAAASISVSVTAVKNAYASGAATSAPVVVAKLSSTTDLRLSASKVRKKDAKKVRAVVSVRVEGVASPTGSLKVLHGRKTLASLTLAPSRKGQVSLKLGKLKKGTYKLRVVYAGGPTTEGSTSRTVKLVVR